MFFRTFTTEFYSVYRDAPTNGASLVIVFDDNHCFLYFLCNNRFRATYNPRLNFRLQLEKTIPSKLIALLGNEFYSEDILSVSATLKKNKWYALSRYASLLKMGSFPCKFVHNSTHEFKNRENVQIISE